MSNCKANSCCTNTNYFWEDYCSYHERCLSKLQQYKNIPEIREIETFETWFNKNCGYVISQFFYYQIGIIVFEPSVKNIGENLSAIRYNDVYLLLEGAKDGARKLKEKLQNSDFHATPMLEIHPKQYNYEYFSDLITSPYVIRESLPNGTSEPSRYLKPLDIVGTDRGEYCHVGVGIGNGLVCHFNKNANVLPAIFSNTRIDGGSDFVKGYNGSVYRYHPIIPFKNYRKIAKQIAGAEDVNYREGNYELANRNCEHLANMLVYGINYSEQIYEKREKIVTKNILTTVLLSPSSLILNNGGSINNGKGSTIKLSNEMSESNDKLGGKTNNRSDNIERRYLQEVPTKENCRIM